MKYENARDILPPELLRQIQKHVSGQLIYIPAREKRRDWGAVSGYRDQCRRVIWTSARRSRWAKPSKTSPEHITFPARASSESYTTEGRPL